MRRMLFAAPITAGALLLAAGPVGATTPTTTKRTSRPATTYEVSAGRFRTRAAADKRVAALSNKGLTGFTVEPENHRFEVERPSSSRTAAATELRAVRHKGFHASLEIERTGSAE